MLSRRRWHLPSLNIYSIAHNNFPIIDYFWHFSRLAFISCLHFHIEIKMRCKQKVNMIFQVPLIHRGWHIRKIWFAKKCIFCKKKRVETQKLWFGWLQVISKHQIMCRNKEIYFFEQTMKMEKIRYKIFQIREKIIGSQNHITLKRCSNCKMIFL